MNNQLEGKRIELVSMDSDPNPVPEGTQGEVILVDDIGTIHVEWDNGRSLGLVKGEDRFKKI